MKVTYFNRLQKDLEMRELHRHLGNLWNQTSILYGESEFWFFCRPEARRGPGRLVSENAKRNHKKIAHLVLFLEFSPPPPRK